MVEGDDYGLCVGKIHFCFLLSSVGAAVKHKPPVTRSTRASGGLSYTTLFYFFEVLPFYMYYTEANAKMAIFDHFCI